MTMGLGQRLRIMDHSGLPLLVARLVLGGMFIYMGWAKAIDPVDFLKLIREYEMFPPRFYLFLNFTAVVLPWLELLCGVLLIFGAAVRGAALLLVGLLTFFTIMIFLRGLGIHETKGIPFCDIEFDCGCGAGVVNICHKLPENIGLLLLAVYCLLSRADRLCVRKNVIQ